MTDPTALVTRLEERINAARMENSELCHGKQWRMTIPVQETDSDFIFARLADDAQQAAAALTALAAERDEAKAWNDRLTGVKFSERVHLALTARAESAEQEAKGLQVAVKQLGEEVTRLRAALNDSCACQHDGRGELVSECQEHQDIREERDRLRAGLKRIGEEIVKLP